LGNEPTTLVSAAPCQVKIQEHFYYCALSEARYIFTNNNFN